MRVAGPNPMVMKGIDTVPDNFAVTEAHFQRAFQAHSKSGLNGAQADSLEAAVAEGRLFLCDYAALAGIPSGTYPHGRAKYVTPAMVLMATTPDTHRLLPVAIQCGQTPGDEAPVFTPGHRYWTLAKLAANVADGTHHQAVAHLAWTHLTIEPAVLAARRQLAPAHPIYRLLHCHQEGTLFINDAANTKLMAPDGGVDAVMVPEIHAARAATVAAVQSWDFTEMMFPAELESRGLMNSDVLPDHPYRDDGLLVWTALKEWATDFIAIYYRTDEDVLGDCELQAFFTELGSPDGGRISGIGMDGKISNLPALIDAVTQLMFTPSAQHAAVNFPQAELMTFVPNLPLSAYAPPPGAHETAAASDLLLRTLPPLDIAEYQQVLGHLLGVTRHGKLGHYPGHVLGGNFAHDPRVDAPLKALMSRLTTIEEQITGRNQERWKPYEYLLPSLIPQSINI
jgi:arachidonate 15-lipoxygenase